MRADSCTVTLLSDANSIVGARLERSRALGRLTGAAPAGSVRHTDKDVGLTLAPGGSATAGDVVVTAGSPGDVPYPAGVPIGTVSRVEADRGQSERVAAVTPFVELGALDVVGVLVPRGH